MGATQTLERPGDKTCWTKPLSENLLLPMGIVKHKGDGGGSRLGYGYGSWQGERPIPLFLGSCGPTPSVRRRLPKSRSLPPDRPVRRPHVEKKGEGRRASPLFSWGGVAWVGPIQPIDYSRLIPQKLRFSSPISSFSTPK